MRRHPTRAERPAPPTAVRNGTISFVRNLRWWGKRLASIGRICCSDTYGILPTSESPDLFAATKDLANYGADRFFAALPEIVGGQSRPTNPRAPPLLRTPQLGAPTMGT